MSKTRPRTIVIADFEQILQSTMQNRVIFLTFNVGDFWHAPCQPCQFLTVPINYICRTMALCLETEQLETVQRILSLHFEGLEVWAYGPRLTGVDLTPETELDLVVIAERPLSFEAMTAVEKAFAESGLSFRVDVMDWAKLPETMQKQIKKEHEVVQTVAED
jgi:hypothetical protein